jgi:hypothetical protein
MKKIITYSFLVLVVLLSACRKTDNDKIPELTRVPVPNLTKNVAGGATGGDAVISAVNQTLAGAFKGVFTLALAFPEDTKPSKMEVVVRKNGVNSNVKVVVPNVTTFPSTITVTGTQLIGLFGPILLGDKFDFGADIYTAAGSKFEAFPVVGAGYGAGVSGQYGFVTTSVSYSAICNFLPATYTGNFVIVADGWADYGVGDVITLSNVSANQFSFKYATSSTPLPIICTVNADNSITVANQVYGDYGPANGGPFSCFTTAATSSDNFVTPCDGLWQVRLFHTNNLGSYGSYIIKAKKQ